MYSFRGEEPRSSLPAATVDTAPRLCAGLGWSLAGALSHGFAQWLVVVIIARLATPAAVGGYAFAQAVVVPIFFFLNFQLRELLATDQERSFRLRSYICLRLSTAVLGVFVSMMVGIWSGRAREAPLMVFLVAAIHAADSFSHVIFGRLQQQERLDLVSRSLLLRSVMGVCALACTMAATRSVVVGLAALLATRVISLAAVDLGRLLADLNSGSAHASCRRTAVEVGVLIKMGLPLGLATSLTAVSAQVPVYLTEIYVGQDGVGLYAAAAQLVAVGGLVVGAIGQAVSPRAARYWASGEWRMLQRLCLRSIGGVFILGILGILASCAIGDWIVSHVYGPSFAGAGHLTVLAASGALAMLASMINFLLTAARSLVFQVVAACVGTLLAVLVGGVLIKPMGVVGAAWSSFAANAAVVGLASGRLFWVLLRRPWQEGNLETR